MDIEKELDKINDEVAGRIKEQANKIEEDVGIPSEEVVLDYIEEIANLEETYPDRDRETVEHQAWIRKRGRWESEKNSDIPLLEGIIIGAGDAFDPQRRRKEEALEKKKDDFDKAVKNGYINKEGEILDDNGNVIPENNHVRQIEGFFRKVGSDDEPKKFWLRLTGWRATNVEVPVLEPVRFRAEIADFEGGREGFEYLNVNDNNFSFEKIDSEIFTAKNAINHDYLQDKFTKLHDINGLHSSRLGFSERHTTEGDVVYVDRRPNNVTGNMRLAITTDEMEEGKSITVWIPEHLHDKIDFQTGSKVFVYGYIREDEYEGETTYSIQAWAVHPYEDWVIREESNEVVEEDDNFTEVYA